MSYKHLTLQGRYLINAYKSTKTQKEIAEMIGVHPSTVSRELQRGKGNVNQKGYWPIASHNKAIQQQQVKSQKANLKLTEETIRLISKYLLQQYSPEQISAVFALKHKQAISHVTIYKYIDINRLNEGDLYQQLRHRGKRRTKYGLGRKHRIAGRVSIDHRPSIVEEKTRLGDFEIDTIVGKGRQGKAAFSAYG